MKFKDREYIGLYHNPETGLWAKQTMKNYKNGKTFSWKPIEKFPPRFLPKITMLNVAGFDVRIPYIGRLRKSQKHKGLHVYFLFNEHWYFKDTKETS
jgi:hypothetical protein